MAGISLPGIPRPGGTDVGLANAAIAAGQSVSNDRYNSRRLDALIENDRAQRAEAQRRLDLEERQQNLTNDARYVDPGDYAGLLPPDVRDSFSSTFQPGKRVLAAAFEKSFPIWQQQSELRRQGQQADEGAQAIREAGKVTTEGPIPEGQYGPGSPVTSVSPRAEFLAKMFGQSVKNPATSKFIDDYLKPKPFNVAPGASAYEQDPLTGETKLIAGGPQAGTGPENLPEPQRMANGMWRVPKVNEQTGRVDWSVQFDPNYKAGTVTHEDALRSLQANGKIPPTIGLTEVTPQQHADVVNEMTRLQAAASGQKAAQVTVNTGNAKLDVPIGAEAQQWLNPQGEMPPPTMSKADVMKSYLPYKDAVKRLDQEGASRTFLQHLQFLKEQADLFPASTGNAVSDLAVAQASAYRRRILGQQDPAVKAVSSIDRPAALQMIRAVAPDARAGARLQKTFEELTDPLQAWTKESYLTALDGLEKMALTGMAQRGRPGMTPQPGPAIPPAGTGERSPSPVVPGRGAGNDPLGIRR